MKFNEELQQEQDLMARAELVKMRRERDSATNELTKIREQLEAANRALAVVSSMEAA